MPLTSARTVRCTAAFLSLCILIGMHRQVHAEGFSISCEDSLVTVRYGGKLVTKYHYRDRDAKKPYLWPVIGPTGKAMTRAFPMETVDGEQHDHPHHRGVWFGHQGVAGTDVWLEVVSKKYDGKELQKFLASLGTIAHTSFTEISSNEKQAIIRSQNDYLDSTGKQLMADDRDVATWSKMAEWVDYNGPVDGEHLGVAFMDHPSSFRHPTRWHVRDYGLFTANAFGQHNLEPSAVSGTYTSSRER